MRERNADRHRATAVGLPLDDWEHAKDESSERALDLDLLRGGVELEVLYELGEEGLHLDDPKNSGYYKTKGDCDRELTRSASPSSREFHQLRKSQKSLYRRDMVMTYRNST